MRETQTRPARVCVLGLMPGSNAARTLSFALACLLAACTRQIDSGEQLPSNPAPRPHLQRTSSVTLRASLPLSRLESLVDEAAPPTWDIDERLSALRIKFHGRIQRGPIRLSPAGSHIGFAADVHGHGSAPVSWDVRGTLQGSLLPQIAPDYRLLSNLDVRASLSQAKLALSLLPDVSVRGLLEKRLAEESLQARERVDEALNEEPRLQREARRLWQTGFAVTPLGDEHDAYLVSRPTALLVSSPRLDTEGPEPELTLGLGLSAELEVVYGPAPEPPTVLPLPPATLRPIDSGRVAIRLPMMADPAALAESFSRRAQARRLELDGTGVRVVRIEAAGSGRQLLLKCTVRSVRGWRPLEAQLFITGTPYLDAERAFVRLRDLDVTVASRHALVHSAGFLLSPLLTQYLADRAAYPLAKLEDKARRGAERWAADLEAESDGAFRAEFSRISIDAVGMDAGYLVVEASAEGTIDTRLESLLPARDPGL